MQRTGWERKADDWKASAFTEHQINIGMERNGGEGTGRERLFQGGCMVLLACIGSVLIFMAGVCVGMLISREKYLEVIQKYRDYLSMVERDRNETASRMESFEVDLRKRISGGY